MTPLTEVGKDVPRIAALKRASFRSQQRRAMGIGHAYFIIWPLLVFLLHPEPNVEIANFSASFTCPR